MVTYKDALDFRFDLNHSAAVRLIQILLPIYHLQQYRRRALRAETFYRFTRRARRAIWRDYRIHARPVRGLWQEREQVVRDDLISYESMIEALDEKWCRRIP